MAFVNKTRGSRGARRLMGANQGREILFFVIVCVIAFLAASSVVPFWAQDKNFPVPDVLLCTACLIPCYLSYKNSLVFAAVLGFFCDLFINEPTSFSPLVFLVGVVLASLCHRHFTRKTAIVAAVCMLLSFVLKAAVDMACFMLKFEDAVFFEVIKTQSLPFVVVSFAAAIVVAYIVEIVAKRFGIYTL